MKTLEKMPEIDLDATAHETQLEEANAFFHLPEMSNFKNGGNPYADKDGLIEFICGIGLSQDPVVTAKLKELRSILISVTSIVAAYVNRYADAKGPQYKTDIELWAMALSRIPLMGPSRIDNQRYKQITEGTKIPANIATVVLDVVPGDGATLNSFKSFLGQQGNNLRTGIEQNRDYYKTITVGLSVEVLKIGDRFIYIPRVKLYRANFTRDNSKWSALCTSRDTATMEFDYLYASCVFDYEALSNPEIKREFNKFIEQMQRARIEEATTFFNGDFNVAG